MKLHNDNELNFSMKAALVYRGLPVMKNEK
jgi:hypothetical protein